MRYTFKPSQRGKWTHFRGMLYWRGSEQGGKLSEKRQAMWTQFLEKSMQVLLAPDQIMICAKEQSGRFGNG
jgi:hypothetical protein